MQESHRGRTYNAIEAAAANGQSAAAAFLEWYHQRDVDALYDLAEDPWCKHNIAGDKQSNAKLAEARQRLEEAMVASEDPMLPVFRGEKSVTEAFPFKK